MISGSSNGGSQSSVDFLISSEETGFRHLYYVKAGLNIGHNQIRPEGDEEVLRQKRLQVIREGGGIHRKRPHKLLF